MLFRSAASRDDIIHQSDMESLHGKFKLKGIFQVLPAQAGIERMLHGARSLARQAVATPDAPTPAGQRSAQLIALIINPGASGGDATAARRPARLPAANRRAV